MLIAVIVLLVFVIIMGAGIIAQRRALNQQRPSAAKNAAPAPESVPEQRRHRAGDVVLIAGPDLIARQASPISLFLLGYPPESLAGTSLLGLVHPDDAGLLAEFARLRGTSGPTTIVVRCHHRGGSWVWFEAAARHDPSPGSDAIEFVARDVADRMRAQDWLAAQRSLADAVLTMATDAVISIDADERIVAWNRAAENILGWRRDEVIGRDVADIVMPPELRDAYRDGIRGLWQRGVAGRVDEPTDAVVLRRDGYPLPVEATAWIVEAGQAKQLTTLIRDVSARKQAEAASERARSQAVEASRLKSEILANTSHELRTPMNGVIGMADLLLETALDDTQRRFAEGIKTAGGTLLTVINDILDYATMESGRVAVDQVDFDVRELIEDVVGLVAEAGAGKGVEVVGYCRPGLPTALRGDPARLRQVLLNLAGNAVKFTERGEVAVRAGWATGATEKPDMAAIRFEVADTGIGIAAADRERLFEAFRQADTSTTRRHGGSGLGLAIADRLVSAMGGHLTVDSEVGQGSTFWFDVALARQVDGQPSARGHHDDLTGLRVLVADDSGPDRTVLEGQLRSWRMVPAMVDSAPATVAALRAATARHRPYDVVILAATVPDLDPMEVAREISADPTIGLAHILLLDSHRPVDDASLHSAGVACVLSKPVRQEELFEHLARAAVRPVRSQLSTMDSHALGIPFSTPMDPPARPQDEGPVRTEAITAAQAEDHPMTYPQADTEAYERSPEKLHNGVPVGGSALATHDAGAGNSGAVPSRGTVLLAENDDVNQQVATAMLARLGYHADVVGDGFAAVELAGRRTYDAVLMDVQMPELDGVAATAELRHREGSARHTPVIALTAGADAADRDRYRAAGIDDYLTRPIMSEDLRTVLERWIGEATPARQ